LLVQHLTIIIAAAVLSLTVPAALRAQEFPLARYGIPDELVLADSGEMKFVGEPPPLQFRLSDPRASAAFILAFVVDTLGKVEMPSVSFGNDVSQPILKAVCRALRVAEYHPLKRDGRLRRALTVEMLIIRQFDTPAAGRVSATPLRTAIKENGIVETLPILAKQPHCE
jgi:hypothetical protein